MVSKSFLIDQAYHDLALKENDICTSEVHSVYSIVPSSLAFFGFAVAAADSCQLSQFPDGFDCGFHLLMSTVAFLIPTCRGHLACWFGTPLTPGCCGFPASHPGTGPSEKDQGAATPPRWISQPHSSVSVTPGPLSCSSASGTCNNWDALSLVPSDSALDFYLEIWVFSQSCPKKRWYTSRNLPVLFHSSIVAPGAGPLQTGLILAPPKRPMWQLEELRGNTSFLRFICSVG